MPRAYITYRLSGYGYECRRDLHKFRYGYVGPGEIPGYDPLLYRIHTTLHKSMKSLGMVFPSTVPQSASCPKYCTDLAVPGTAVPGTAVALWRYLRVFGILPVEASTGSIYELQAVCHHALSCVLVLFSRGLL